MALSTKSSSETGKERRRAYLRNFGCARIFLDFYSRLDLSRLKLFVVSNQPDIKRSLMDEESLARMTSEMQKRFAFTEIVYCEHDDSDACSCRKPKPGMLNYLIEKYDLARDRCLLIGDRDKDIGAAAAAGVKSVLLLPETTILDANLADGTPNGRIVQGAPITDGADTAEIPKPDYILTRLTDLWDRVAI